MAAKTASTLGESSTQLKGIKAKILTPSCKALATRNEGFIKTLAPLSVWSRVK